MTVKCISARCLAGPGSKNDNDFLRPQKLRALRGGTLGLQRGDWFQDVPALRYETLGAVGFRWAIVLRSRNRGCQVLDPLSIQFLTTSILRAGSGRVLTRLGWRGMALPSGYPRHSGLASPGCSLA